MRKRSFKHYSNLFAIFHYLSKYKPHLYGTFFLLSLSAITVLSIGSSLKYFTNQGLAGIIFLKKSIFFFAILLLILSIASACRSYLIELLCHNVCSDIRKDLYKKIIQTKPQYLETNKFGNINTRIMHDVSIIQNVIPTIFSFFIRNLIMMIGGTILLFITSVYLTTITIIIVPIALMPLIFIGKKLKNLSIQSQKTTDLVSNKLEETVTAIKEIQAHCQEKRATFSFNQLLVNFIIQTKKQLMIRSLLVGGVIFVVSYTVIGIFWLGSYQVILTKMQPGALASFVFYAIVVASSLAGMSEVYSDFNKAAGAADRIYEILQLKLEHNTSKKNFNKYIINFENVSFHYPNRQKNMVLDNFNLQVNEGEKIAITGQSGIGKTTILQLLLKFYQPLSGNIFIDKHNINDLSNTQLRQLISYVSQDPYIFEATLKENLLYATQQASQQDLENIIKALNLESLAKSLPHGINSILNQKATSLSGGQKHRIALARALLRPSKILLLDEVTTGLDDKNENLVCNIIKKEKRTVIVITHKSPLIQICDKVIKI